MDAETDSATRRYATPDGTQVAPYGGFWSRFIASIVDWAICFWAPFFALGFVMQARRAIGDFDGLTVWDTAPLLLLPVIILAYFTYFLGRGRSIGMRALGLRMVNVKTGGPPGVWRALLKAFLNLMLAASIFFTYAAMWAFGDPVSRTRIGATDLAAYIAAMVLVAVLGILGRLWMLWDSKRQTWQDKVCGGVVIVKTPPPPSPAPQAVPPDRPSSSWRAGWPQD